MPITLTCEHCSGTMVVPPSRKDRKRFCSRTCWSTWLSENQRGEAHPMKGRRHSPESLAKMREGKANQPRGRKSATWAGGRFKAKGYVMLNVEGLSPSDRALAVPMLTRGRGYLPEHRLVMARKLGRPLVRGEIVHHRNGRKADNRPNNLELRTTSSHTREHHEVLAELRQARAMRDAMTLACLSLLATSRRTG